MKEGGCKGGVWVIKTIEGSKPSKAWEGKGGEWSDTERVEKEGV